MVTTATKNKRPMSLAEQQRNLALLECLTHPQNVIDKSQPLPSVIENNLEKTIDVLASLMFDDYMRRNP